MKHQAGARPAGQIGREATRRRNGAVLLVGVIALAVSGVAPSELAAEGGTPPLEIVTDSRTQIAQATDTAKSVTESDLAAQVAEKAGLSSEQAAAAVEALFAGIAESLAEGTRVEIRDFGAFFIMQRKARSGRNPETGEEIHVPLRRLARFNPAMALKNAIDSTEP